MAYAIVAGVPPEYGIYTSVIQGIIGALFSSSEHVTTGPTNTQSLLIAATVHRLVADPANPMYLELVFTLTMLKGLIQLSFAFAKMGNITRYVSKSVIIGVTAGAGVLILAGQLKHFLGVPVDQAVTRLPGVLGDFQELWPNLGNMNPYAVMIGVISMAIIISIRFVSPFLPGALTAVVVGAGLVWALGWTDGTVVLIPPLPQTLPSFQIPQFNIEQVESMMTGALALAIIGMLESVSIAKAIAAHTGERINANQEFFTQGLKNFVTSFFQCIPGSVSFTRSALDYAAGAQTRFAAVFNGCFVAVIYLTLAPQAQLIPMASLAAVLFVIGTRLIDWRYLRRVAKSNKHDALVCLATFMATILLPLQYAIFVGIFLNIALFLHQAGRLHLAEVVSPNEGPFVERPVRDKFGQDEIIFIQAEGDLFFAVADELQERLATLANSPVNVVVLRLKRTHSMDATVLTVLEDFAKQMKARGGHLILCGVSAELRVQVDRFGLTAILGKDNVFETKAGVFTSAKLALQRARDLVSGDQGDASMRQGGPQGWAYQI
jgi:SulP family sulfate permease